MKHAWKRLLAVLLTLAICVALFPAAALAEDGEGTIAPVAEDPPEEDPRGEEEGEGTLSPVQEEGEDPDLALPPAVPYGLLPEGDPGYSAFIPARPLGSGRFALNNTKGATGADIVNEARKWADSGAVYWTVTDDSWYNEDDKWILSIALRTGYTTNGQTSFDCSGFVGRVLNDAGFRGADYAPPYGSGHVLMEHYGKNCIAISIEELVKYGTDINEEVARARNGDFSGLRAGDVIGWTSGDLGRHVIIYAGLNSQGKPSMVEFTGSGYYDREITERYRNAFQYGARFAEDPSSYLDLCVRYPSCVSGTTAAATPLKKYPCDGETDRSSVDLTAGDLPVGTRFTGTGLYRNTKREYWYQVRLESGDLAGTEGYLPCAAVSAQVREDEVSYSGKDFPWALVTGNSYLVDWTVHSTLLDITEAQGYILGGQDLSQVLFSGSVSQLSTRSYCLRSSPIDNALTYGQLPAGQYKTVIRVCTRNWYSPDGETLASVLSEHFPISFVFTEVLPGTHIHDKGSYLYCESAHPHRKCYRCSSCGAEWTDPNSFTLLPDCRECRGETLEAPVITAQPESLRCREGAAARFSVEAEGEELSFQWYYRKPGAEAWLPVSAASGKTAAYSLTAAKRHDGYQYKCVVSNAAGREESSAADLTVITKPVLTRQPEDLTVMAGQTAGFSVEAEGPDLSFRWYYRASAEGSWTAVRNNGTGPSLSLTAAQRHNGYEYRCKVTNSAGSVYSLPALLTVEPAIAPPAITAQPRDLTVRLGTRARFQIQAEGEELSYQWYYRVSADDAWKAVNAASGKTAVYRLVTAARHNGYQYCCQVSNRAGTVTSDPAALSLTPDITIRSQPRDLTVDPGQRASFEVTAVGEDLQYQWYYRKPGAETWLPVSAASGKTAVYSLTAAARHNGYAYRCLVSDSFGSVSSDIALLTVRAQPSSAVPPRGSPSAAAR